MKPVTDTIVIGRSNSDYQINSGYVKIKPAIEIELMEL
jgi:hypothetical protein